MKEEKTIYKKPKIEIVMLDKTDIITTSDKDTDAIIPDIEW